MYLSFDSEMPPFVLHVTWIDVTCLMRRRPCQSLLGSLPLSLVVFMRQLVSEAQPGNSQKPSIKRIEHNIVAKRLPCQATLTRKASLPNLLKHADNSFWQNTANQLLCNLEWTSMIIGWFSSQYNRCPTSGVICVVVNFQGDMRSSKQPLVVLRVDVHADPRPDA